MGWAPCSITSLVGGGLAVRSNAHRRAVAQNAEQQHRGVEHTGLGRGNDPAFLRGAAGFRSSQVFDAGSCGDVDLARTTYQMLRQVFFPPPLTRRP